MNAPRRWLAVGMLTSRHTKEVTMAQSTASAPRDQFRSRRDQFAKQEGLPFLKLLSQAYVEAACRNADREISLWIHPHGLTN